MSSPRSDFRFKCQTCEEWHEGLPDLGFDAPDPYLSLSDEERATNAMKSDDLCTIDDEDFFVRGIIELPILGHDESFGLGVWVSLKRENFYRYIELFDSPAPEDEGPYFGWLCNRITGYPETLYLKTNVHLRPAPMRPRIELEPTDHPLAVHQRAGIAIAEVQAVIERSLHPQPVS